MITAARGDTRPCVRGACTGLMHFGRQPEQVAASGNVKGWVCDTVSGHFMTASGAFSSDGFRSVSASASFSESSSDDDDGGVEERA